jgi:hypothetical protein
VRSFTGRSTWLRRLYRTPGWYVYPFFGALRSGSTPPRPERFGSTEFALRDFELFDGTMAHLAEGMGLGIADYDMAGTSS